MSCCVFLSALLSCQEPPQPSQTKPKPKPNPNQTKTKTTQNRVKEAEETERSINEARESYRPAATRASILYFVIADLALINPMYQFSLNYFGRLFKACVEGSGASEDIPTRLGLLSAYTTEFVFKNVSRGLFEEHKALFSFLLASSIARHPSAGEILEAEWAFFLRGAPAVAVAGAGGAAAAGGVTRPGWLPEGGWKALVHLECAAAPGAFRGLLESVARSSDAAAWRAWYDADEPHLAALPGAWESWLPQSSFTRLLLLRALREEKLAFGCMQ